MASSRLVAPELATIKVHGMTREAFLMRSTLAAGAAYGTLSATGLISKAIADSGSGDVDILNFALTLEFLENEFYVQAVDRVSGLSDYEGELTRKLRDDEKEHIDALSATITELGGTPVDKPTFDFGDAFASRAAYFKLANTLEDTGVSAYNGAGTMIESGEVLGAAGSIVQIEARHAAMIRLVRDVAPAPLGFDKASTVDEVTAAIEPLISS